VASSNDLHASDLYIAAASASVVDTTIAYFQSPSCGRRVKGRTAVVRSSRKSVATSAPAHAHWPISAGSICQSDGSAKGRRQSFN